MKWFIPGAKDEEGAIQVYQAIKKHLGKELGAASFANRRIRKINFYDNRKTYEAEVGKRLLLTGEKVIAILYEPARDLYHVCTPTRGVLRGISVLVGGDEVSFLEDFDPE